MKKYFIITSMLLIFILYLNSQADARPQNEIKGRFGIFGNLGNSLLNPEDLNDKINGLGQLRENQLEKINRGLNLNWGIYYGFSENFLIGLQSGGVNINETFTYQNGDYLKIDMRAWEVGPFIKAGVPVGERILLLAGAHINYFSITNGVVHYDDGNIVTGNEYNGSTLSFKISGGLDFYLTRNVVLGIEGGYRLASFANLEGDPSRLWPDFSLDLSGFYYLAVIKICFG